MTILSIEFDYVSDMYDIYAYLFLKAVKRQAKTEGNCMNILLVSHGMLCKGMGDAYRMFFPAASNVSTVSLTNAGVEPFRVELKKILNDLLSKGDVLIMSDVKGGTPYNESYMCFLENPQHIRLIAGLNLPMLLELGVSLPSDDDLQAAYEVALDAGTNGVVGTELPADSSDDDELDLF